ncbi:hypothetical protein FE840_017335 [Peteryoungia desertarenae]|uniref:Cell division and transport-associated protein TolA n=1 Tax=Peteryoungia desertarenae TaxID=1813451 RepID=A0ABX6QSC6_9HYPH|nr:cell envelope integrity protein TolA [Peteryoungia desertarenae]QLF71176.1 hypothetical protein FE840_017335 [Peteryoungia desertarenae]
MKGSIIASSLIHGLALSVALVSLGSPEKLEFANVETLPVDIVPIEEFTQIQRGDKNAPLGERSAPVPTSRPPIAEQAENFGDNDVDLKTPPRPSERPPREEVATAPPKVEEPAPAPVPTPTEVAEAAPAETAPPSPPEETPQEAAPEPQPAAEAIPLPEKAPVPPARPKVETASIPQRSEPKPEVKPDPQREETTRQQQPQMDSSFNADEVAALLNNVDAAGGGARRSTDEAALGGRSDTGGEKLSQSELDALRGIIENNWLITPGMADAQDVRVRVTFRLDPDGNLIGQPEATATGGSPTAQRVLISGAVRAVRKSAPFSNLPKDKYETWSEVVVNFDPSQLM